MSLIKNFVVRRQTPFYFPLIPFEKTVTVVVVLKGEKGENGRRRGVRFDCSPLYYPSCQRAEYK